MGLFDFDILTLRTAIAVVVAFAALLFGVVASVYPEEKALRTWAISNGLTAVTAIALLFAEVLQSVPLLVGLGSLYSVGQAIGWVGLRQLCSAPGPWRILAQLAGAGFALVFFLPALGIIPLNYGMRYVFWGMPGLVTVAWSFDLLRLRGHLRWEYAWFLALCSLSGAVALLGSGIFGLAADITGQWQGLKPVVLEFALALMIPGTLAINWSATLMFSAKMRDALRHLAETDGLTGLPNRSGFTARANGLLATSSAKRLQCSLLVIDLDHFKSINDLYGHDGGDDVLRSFSHLLKRRVRGEDVVGRIGGEEFCLLLPGTELDAARQMAERLRHEAEAQPVPFNGTTIPMSTSIGVATVEPGDTFETLFNRADKALYAAKSSGRNRVMVAGAASGA